MTATLDRPTSAAPSTLAIARPALRAALSKLLTVVDTTSKALPIAQHVLLEAEDGRLTMTATNFEAWARVALTCEFTGAASALLPAKTLSEIVASLPPVGAITLMLDDSRAVIQAGRSRFELAGLPASDFPEVPAPPAHAGVTVNAFAFLDALARAVAHASDEPSRPSMNAVRIEREGDRLIAVACDGPTLARLSAGSVTGEGFAAGCSVHRDGAPILARLFGDLAADATLTVSADSGRLRLDAADGAFGQVRLVDQSFPPYAHVLATEQPTHTMVCDGALLAAAVRRVGIASDGQTRRIDLLAGETGAGRVAGVVGDEITIRSGTDGRAAVDGVALDRHDRAVAGAAFAITVNVTKLTIALATLGADRVQLTANDAARLLFLRGAEQDPADPTLIGVSALVDPVTRPGAASYPKPGSRS